LTSLRVFTGPGWQHQLRGLFRFLRLKSLNPGLDLPAVIIAMFPGMTLGAHAYVPADRIRGEAKTSARRVVPLFSAVKFTLPSDLLCFSGMLLLVKPSKDLENALPRYATQPGGYFLPIVRAVDRRFDAGDGRGPSFCGDYRLWAARTCWFLRLAGSSLIFGPRFPAVPFRCNCASGGKTRRAGVLSFLRSLMAAGIAFGQLHCWLGLRAARGPDSRGLFPLRYRRVPKRDYPDQRRSHTE